MEYSPLLSSGLRFIERSQHSRSASTSDLPRLLPPPRKLPNTHTRSSSVNTFTPPRRGASLGHRTTDDGAEKHTAGTEGQMNSDVLPLINVSSIPLHDNHTSYLSMNDSDSDSDMDVDEVKSTFLDFSDTASSSSHLPPPRPPLAFSQPQPIPIGMESFLSVSPLPQEPDIDSPVHISPTRQFFLPPRFVAGRLARPRHRDGRRDAMSIQSAPALQSFTRESMNSSDAEDLHNDWRYMVDNFMDIQDD